MRVLLFLAALLTAFSAVAQRAPNTVPGPTVKVGDTWIFNKLSGHSGALDQVTLNVVRKVAADGILMDSSNLDGSNVYKVRRTAGFNLVGLTGADGYFQSATPFYPNFAFPLAIGKTWKGKVSFAASDKPGDQVTADLEARVIGWESVTVPAGNFMALKIVMTGWYKGQTIGGWPLDGWIEDTLWYSPEARNAVRYEYKDSAGGVVYNHDIQELMRYWLVP